MATDFEAANDREVYTFTAYGDTLMYEGGNDEAWLATDTGADLNEWC